MGNELSSRSGTLGRMASEPAFPAMCQAEVDARRLREWFGSSVCAPPVAAGAMLILRDVAATRAIATRSPIAIALNGAIPERASPPRRVNLRTPTRNGGRSSGEVALQVVGR